MYISETVDNGKKILLKNWKSPSFAQVDKKWYKIHHK